VTLALDTRASAAAFLARVLEAPEIAAEYPLVFAPGSPGQLLAIEERGEILAACAILAREFRLGEHGVRGGLIGSVAVDPSQRRRGLGTRLLAQAETALAERGCVFALLWADDPRFYLARGYAPFGVEDDFLVPREIAPALPPPSGVRELRESDVPFLHRLHARHPARVERSLDEMRGLLGIPRMLTLVRERAASPDQPPLPVAYACLGRGRDLPDAIHEWAGETEDVLALVRAHLERRDTEVKESALFLLAPPAASDLAYRLLRLGAMSRRGILGLGKILDPTAAARLLSDALGAPGAALARPGRPTDLRGPHTHAELDLDTLAALLFGGPEVRDEARNLLQRLGFDGVRLPLECFAWGLDSI
jgi:GNAT superfamily N-acetyltransferase